MRGWLSRQAEQPARKARELADSQLELLVAEIRRRFGVPPEELGGDPPDAAVFEQLALQFMAEWRGANPGPFKLAMATPDVIEEFCTRNASCVYGQVGNLPVWYSRYCEKCDKTLIIRAESHRGFAAYEQLYCPHCRADLGQIRADGSFEIIAERSGDLGDAQWQGPGFPDLAEQP